MNVHRLLLVSVPFVLLFSGAAALRAEPYEVERKNGIVFAEPGGVKLLLDLYLPKGVESPPLESLRPEGAFPTLAAV